MRYLSYTILYKIFYMSLILIYLSVHNPQFSSAEIQKQKRKRQELSNIEEETKTNY